VRTWDSQQAPSIRRGRATEAPCAIPNDLPEAIRAPYFASGDECPVGPEKSTKCACQISGSSDFDRDDPYIHIAEGTTRKPCNVKSPKEAAKRPYR